MKSAHILYLSLFVLSLTSASVNVCAPDTMYFHDTASVLNPTHAVPDLQFPTISVDPQYQLYTSLKQELLSAQSEEHINHLIDEIIVYSICYAQPALFQVILDEVNLNIAYFEPRVGHRFDYGALKKGLGLGILTGLALYGIKQIQRKYYTPEVILKEQTLTDLHKLGVEHHSHYERNCSYDVYTTDFSGLISRDALSVVQSKISQFKSHQTNADTARGGQCVVGGAGLMAGIAGAGYLYRGFTTDCAHEYVRFSFIKVKLEEAQAALDIALSQVH